MKTHPLPPSYRVVLSLGTGILGAALGFVVFMPHEIGFFRVGLLVLLGAGTLGMALRTAAGYRKYSLEGGDLVVTDLTGRKVYPLDTLISWRDDPAEGVLRLEFPRKKVKIPRKIMGFEHFRKNFYTTEGTEDPELMETPLHLKASLSRLWFDVLILGILGFAAWAVFPELSTLTGLFWWVAGPWTALGGFILFKIFFLEVLSYSLYEDKVTVRTLFWRKVYQVPAATSLKEDVYSADGAHYKVVKLTFSRSNLVLDEFNLHQPLDGILPWIRTRWIPLIESTF